LGIEKENTLLSSLTGKVEEKRTQFYIYDNGDIEFRKLPIMYTTMIEKKRGEIKRVFKHLFKLEFAFNGFGKIPADRVSLGYGRDAVLDIFNILDPAKDKITRASPGKVYLERPWITEIGKNAQHHAHTQKPNTLMWDMVTWTLTAVLLMMALGLVITVLARLRG